MRTAIGRTIAGTAIAALWLLLPASSSFAIGPSEALVKVGEHGSGAGQVFHPEAIATDPANGHIFLVDNENSRIDEFTPWGVFVKAFGWDVAPGGINEQQEVTVKATSGQFRLSFEGVETTNLEHDASAAEVQSALNNLSSISAGGGAVTVKASNSDASSSRYVISFTAGPLKEANVAQLTATNVSLAGGSPSSSVSVATRADGTTPTTGLESCTSESGCKAGSEGTGAGQIKTASIAVGPSGDVYVRNYAEANQRVQVFDAAGRFLFMFGGKVDKTTNANICTKASGDTCGAGVPGTGPGEFEAGAGLGIGIAVAPSGNVFVADKERIQEFEADGTYLRSIAVAGKAVWRLAIDPASEDLLITFPYSGPEFDVTNAPDVHELDQSGTEVCSFPASNPIGFAAGPGGEVFTSTRLPSEGHPEAIFEYDGSCPAHKISELPLGEPSPQVRSLAANSAGDVLVGRSAEGVDYVQVYGPPPVQFEPPPPGAPVIATQFALSASASEAKLRAKINPEFWADTAFYVEYGTGKCSEGGCPLKAPASPELLGAGVVREDVPIEPVLLSGLAEGTVYHYRFVAQSSGGGPVYGLDPDGEGAEEASFEDGLEGTFRTLSTEPPPPGCANRERREEVSVLLPDCRAYEMVSPLDKEHGDTLALVTLQNASNRLSQARADGGALTYSSYRAFAGSEDAPYTSQYLARRGSEGWSSEALAPARDGFGLLDKQGFTENNFKAFSADLCQTWMIFDAEPLLAPGAVAGFPNLYRKESGGPGCPPPALEALNPFTPEESFPAEFAREEAPQLQGTSADGSVTVFRAPWKMTSEAAGGGTYQVYEASGGQLALVCVLPNGTPLGSNCSVGSAGPVFFFGHEDSLEGAVSEDGSHIYWSAAPNAASAGKIYLRVGGSETREVSNAPGAGKTSLAAHFWGAAPDGSKALYVVSEGAKKEKLYEYSAESGETSEIAAEVMGVAGRSADLSYVYYVSKQAVGGPNGEGDSAVAGQPNLYLFHEGTKTFVATLAAADVRVGGSSGLSVYSDTAALPVYHVARATPSGQQLTFISVRPLAGSDPTDAVSGEADEEVFRYDAQSGEIACASCSPAGALPVGRFVEVQGTNFPSQWIAAMIPGADTELHTPRALSDNGSRLFFTSYTSLLPRDTNAKADVYEWEAPGEGGCEEAKAAYSPANKGCLYLISTGESEEDSELIESTPSGNDVFFTTEQSILRPDPGLFDVYDARVGGGFPQPSESQPCEPLEGKCQKPEANPSYQSPAGPSGEANPPIKCPKGKHKVTKNGKTSCAKNKSKHHKKSKKKKAGKSGRAGK